MSKCARGADGVLSSSTTRHVIRQFQRPKAIQATEISLADGYAALVLARGALFGVVGVAIFAGGIAVIVFTRGSALIPCTGR